MSKLPLLLFLLFLLIFSENYSTLRYLSIKNKKIYTLFTIKLHPGFFQKYITMCNNALWLVGWIYEWNNS